MAEITNMRASGLKDKESKDEDKDKNILSGLVNATEVEQVAEKVRKARELPKSPGSMVQLAELITWLKPLSTEMLERLLGYVYRLSPAINNQLVDPNAPNYIDVISGEDLRGLSEQYFIDTHGGGKFEILVKDTDETKKGDRGYFKARLTINSSIHPPKLDYKAVVWSDRANQGYFAWAKGQRIVDENGQVITKGMGQNDNGNSSQGQASQQDVVGVVKVMGELFSKLTSDQQNNLKRQIGGDEAVSKPMTDLLIAKMKEESPNTLLATITPLITALTHKNDTPPQIDTMTPIVGVMSTMMTAMNKSTSDMMTMMMNQSSENMKLVTSLIASQNSGKGEEESFESKMKYVVEIAKMIKGGKSEEETTSFTERLIEKGLTALPSILNMAGNIMQIKSQQGTPGGGGNSQLPNSINSGNSPVPAISGPPVGNPSIAFPQTPTENFPPRGTSGYTPNGSVSGQIDPVHAGIANDLRSSGGLILKALNDGKQGWEYAEEVSSMFGDIVVQTVAKHGADNLISGMKLVPEFWGVVESGYGEEFMKKWIGEFIDYKSIVARMDSGEGEEEIDNTEEEKEVTKH